MPARATRGDETVYEVTYTTDDHHRRYTPMDAPEARGRFVAVFCDSFAFGTGLEDDATLSAALAARLPDFRAYNYGIPGAGPQHAWLRVQAEDFGEGIPEDEGIGLYLYIDCHFNRATGGMPQFNQWVDGFPSLVRAGDAIVNKGSFETAYPWRSRVYRAAYRSPTLRLLDINLPLRPPAGGYATVADILADTARGFQRHKPGSRFVVLLWGAPVTGDRLAEELAARGVAVWDYREVVAFDADRPPFRGTNREEWRFPDGHPRARLVAFVADHLAADITAGLGNSGN